MVYLFLGRYGGDIPKPEWKGRCERLRGRSEAAQFPAHVIAPGVMARAFPLPRLRESLALVPRYVLGVSFASSLLTLQLAAAARRRRRHRSPPPLPPSRPLARSPATAASRAHVSIRHQAAGRKLAYQTNFKPDRKSVV